MDPVDMFVSPCFISLHTEYSVLIKPLFSLWISKRSSHIDHHPHLKLCPSSKPWISGFPKSSPLQWILVETDLSQDIKQLVVTHQQKAKVVKRTFNRLTHLHGLSNQNSYQKPLSIINFVFPSINAIIIITQYTRTSTNFIWYERNGQYFITI